MSTTDDFTPINTEPVWSFEDEITLITDEPSTAIADTDDNNKTALVVGIVVGLGLPAVVCLVVLVLTLVRNRQGKPVPYDVLKEWYRRKWSRHQNSSSRDRDVHQHTVFSSCRQSLRYATDHSQAETTNPNEICLQTRPPSRQLLSTASECYEQLSLDMTTFSECSGGYQNLFHGKGVNVDQVVSERNPAITTTDINDRKSPEYVNVEPVKHRHENHYELHETRYANVTSREYVNLPKCSETLNSQEKGHL